MDSIVNTQRVADMGTININGLAKRALKYELRKEKKYHVAKGRTEGRMMAAKKYMSANHIFELYIADNPTGIKRTMLGRDAKLANKQSVAKYIAKKIKKISQWKWLEDV